MVQAFPQPLDAFTRGFQGSFLPIYQLATKAKEKAEEQKLLAEKRESDKQMKIAEIGISALKLPNPRVRRQALGILAGKLSGGDKALAKHIVTSITNLSDEEQAVMAKDLSDWRTSVLGGHKPSPELQASIDLYSRAFMSGEKSIDDLMKASEHLSKRAGEEQAAGLLKSPGSGAETAQPSLGAAPGAAPEAPVMAGPGTEPGGRGSTALAQEILARVRGGTPPSQAAVTPPSAGSPSPGGIDLATAPIETLRRLQARALTLGTTQGAAAADRIGKFIDSRMKAMEAKAPATREVKQGDNVITQEFDPATRSWRTIGQARRFQPKDEKAPVTREVKRGDRVITQQWNPEAKKFEDVAEAPRFQPREEKTYELSALQAIRDKLAKDDPKRKEIDKRINKLTETTSRFMGYDEQGRPIYAEGAAALTVAEKGKLQQERRLGEIISLELQELKNTLSKSDVGIRGYLNELKNTVGAQLIPALNDPSVTKNRNIMRSIREKGMRLMTTDNRFNVQDRKAIEAMFPSDGIFESAESARDKISMLGQIIKDRTSFVSGQLKDRIPIHEMTLQELGEAYKKKLIDKVTVERALRLFHGFD